MPKSSSIQFISYLLFVLIAWTFYPLLNQTFGVGDDVMNFNTTQSNDYWEAGMYFAKNQGRFFHAFLTPIFAMLIPYFSGNLLITSIINLTLIATIFILLAYLLKELLNQKFFFYMLLVYLLSTVTIDGHYNLLISYPVYFEISIISILCSYILLIKHKHTNNVSLLISSILFYFFGLLFCELHVFYLLIILIINLKDPFKSNFKNIHKNTSLLFIAVTLVYIITYISWRLLFNDGTYSGSQIAPNLSPLSFLKTVLNFSIPSTPIFFFFTDKELLLRNSFLSEGHTQNLLYVLIHSKIEWVIKALLLASIFGYSLRQISGIKNRTAISIIIISFAFIFIPNMLISITSRYAEMGKWENYYYYTFYSFLSFSVFFCSIVVFIKNNISNKIINNILIGLFSFCIFIFSITTDYINSHVRLSLQKSERQIATFNKFIATNEFKSLPENTSVVAPDLFVPHSDNIYFCWDRATIDLYVKNKVNKKLKFVSSFDSLPTTISSPVYYLKYCSNPKFDESYIVFAKTSSTNSSLLYTDSLMLYINSTNKFFTMYFKSDTSKFINGIKINSVNFPCSFKYKDFKLNFIPIQINSTKIDLNSFILTSTIEPNPFNNLKNNFIEIK